MEKFRTRFAPSPTGYLHAGHAYAAWVAYELAQRHGGESLLRFEDIDVTRVREEYYAAAEEDLRWMGIEWAGEPLRQTQRFFAYRRALVRLRQLGLLYPCFCSRKDIARELDGITNAPHGPEGALYPGTCRGMCVEEIAEQKALGRIAAWRWDSWKAAGLCGGVSFSDMKHGVHAVHPELLGDVILARRDIGTSYHVAVVVDDAFQGITHVTRGEDLFHATHVHRCLQHVLGLPVPEYLHHPLIKDSAGKRLAKRDEALSLKTIREQGGSAQTLLEGFPHFI